MILYSSSKYNQYNSAITFFRRPVTVLKPLAHEVADIDPGCSTEVFIQQTIPRRRSPTKSLTQTFSNDDADTVPWYLVLRVSFYVSRRH